MFSSTIVYTYLYTVGIWYRESFQFFYCRYELLFTMDNIGNVSILRKNIKLVILFNPWCIGMHIYKYICPCVSTCVGMHAGVTFA